MNIMIMKFNLIRVPKQPVPVWAAIYRGSFKEIIIMSLQVR